MENDNLKNNKEILTEIAKVIEHYSKSLSDNIKDLDLEQEASLVHVNLAKVNVEARKFARDVLYLCDAVEGVQLKIYMDQLAEGERPLEGLESAANTSPKEDLPSTNVFSLFKRNNDDFDANN